MSDAVLSLPPLDPEIAEFVARMRAASAKYPPRESMSVSRAREVAEIVRKSWTEGGPVMAETAEHQIPTRHGPVRIRIHYPETRRPLPAFVYIHGGGWTLFSVDTHDRLMREYAARAGVAVVGIDYSRAPEARFPQPLEETIDIVRWLNHAGPALGLDVSSLVIGGDSAGGNISVSTALVLRDAGEDLIKGMVLNYGCYDIDFLSESVVRYGGGDYLLTTHMMLWFSWQYLRAPQDAANPLASPLRARLAGLPPAFMAITELDVLYDQNIAMERALKAAGVAVEAHVYKGTVHSFLEAMSIADVSVRAIAETADWLKRLIASRTGRGA
ncbi:alpha/beta hydrolase [Phreatobacter stygius]|uniref:Alpha/beta hydrolase n=1 Tax=Phreatobacter stygius TaxID=1940610 RepID=A0A4D7B8K7_9HYPH|nr:alpha/beta hydrolase [Phreatobacter stygius]QCI66770.1 alpha/beta hydrolase [Phreatobacter stygius]